MCAAKKGGRKPGSRRSSKLSKTKSTLKDKREVEHLDVQSDLHTDDVASAERRRAWVKAEEWEQLPAEAEKELLESLYGDVVADQAPGAKSGPEPVASGPRPDLATNIWFGDAGVGHQDMDGHDGSALVMEGVAWQEKLMESDRRRIKWKDVSGKSRNAGGLEILLGKKKYSWELRFPEKMTGKLGKIFARLPPWTVAAAWDQVDRESLVDAVRELAEAFQLETGKRVIAASIHVETNHDIHVHLVFSGLVPELKPHQYSDSYKDKKLKVHRAEVKASLIEAGVTDSSKTKINAKLYSLYASGTLEDPRTLNHRLIYRSLPLCPRPLKSMGPSYCSKTNLWEASGRDDRVEEVNARAVRRVSFREIVVRKSWDSQGKSVSSTGIYIDLWVWRRWMSIIESKLNDESLALLPESAKAYVERYIKDGDSLPNPELDAARKKAYGDVFMLLATTHEKLAGPDDPPSVAASLPDLIDEIGDIIEAKERLAVKAKMELNEADAGMKSVWQDLAGIDAALPEISTISDWLSEIREALEGKARGITLAVYELAHKSFFPDEAMPKGKTLGELQSVLVERIGDERKRLGDLAVQVKVRNDEVGLLRDGVAEQRDQIEKDRKVTEIARLAAQAAESAAKEKLAPILTREKSVATKENELNSREAAVKSSEATLNQRESRLGAWAKSLKVRLRRRHVWRVSKAMENVATLILGGTLVKKLIKAGSDPKFVVRDEVARLRRAEKVLAEIVGLPSRAAPDSPAGKLRVRAKSILSKNQISRVMKAVPKKAGEEPKIGGSS